jgi:hypothetical protein
LHWFSGTTNKDEMNEQEVDIQQGTIKLVHMVQKTGTHNDKFSTKYKAKKKEKFYIRWWQL